MKKAITTSSAMLVLTLALFGCSSGLDNTTSTIISILTSVMGVSENQAVAGAGSLLGLASQKLSSQDYQKVANAVPGSADLVKKAGELTGLGSNFGSFANVTTALGKLGLTPIQVTKMAGSLADFAGTGGGETVKTLLLQTLK